MKKCVCPPEIAIAKGAALLVVVLILATGPFLSSIGASEVRDLSGQITEKYPQWKKLYEYFHAHPELSLQEKETAARLADELKQLGYEVSTGVGGYGVVAVLENGEGPTLMIRADLDGLPLTEKTGLPYASKVQVQSEDGGTLGVMHACGHDVHMTSLVGVAGIMVERRSDWKGTLVLIGQPAEEIGAGAKAMLEDGLFVRFPEPDFVLAFHVAADLEAGKIGYKPGFLMANVDSVDIEIHGRGGHGAAPHRAIDPVVIAARIVVALQTIVSREIDPLESAVVTVGHIKAGTKRNIIPDSALLQLTIRSYSDESRKQILDAVKRIAEHTAMAAGVSEENLPTITTKDSYTPAVYNDPELTERLAGVWKGSLGEEEVILRPPEMIGEDFSRYGRTESKIPICMFRVGTAKKASDGIVEQSLHSADFAPDLEPTLKGAVRSTVEAALDLLRPGAGKK